MDNQALQLELLKNLNTAVVVHAPDTRIIYNNRRASVLLGLTEDQMLGKMAIDPAWHFINEQNMVMPLDDYPVNRVISSRQSFDNLVLGIVAPQWTMPTWVLVGGFPEFDQKGDLIQVVVNFHDITEQKKDELELRRAKSIIDSSDDAIISKTPGGIIESWNKGAVKLFGYTSQEAIGQPMLMLIPPERENEEAEILARIARGERVEHIETVRRRKDGSLINISSSISPVRDEKGKIIAASTIARDISDRKYIESLLLNERERSKIILNKLVDPVFLKDNEHRIILANSAFYNWFGLEENAVIGKTLAEHLSAKEMQQFLAVDRQVLDTGIMDQREETFTLRGFTRTLITTKTCFVDSFGERYLVGSSHDITERKKAEQEVLIAATAFESHEGMIVTDVNGTILKVNTSFSRITGYSSEEAIGKNPRFLQSGRDNKEFYEVMWDQIKRTGSWDGEIWNRRKNGEIYPEFLTITAVKDVKGNIVNYVGAFTDISLSKASAEEIKNLAFYDPLTKLPNRRLLLDRLHKALANIPRSGNQGALLFLDLDNFKILNDTLGHDIGDLLLQQVAERLKACVREGDTVARLGGDEFLVMLENLSLQSLEAAAQTEAIGSKILVSLNQPYQLGSHKYNCSTSIGATLFGDHKIELDELLKLADIAMYQAKKAGRNTLRFFDPKMQEAITTRSIVEGELRKALLNNQFKLHYQLQVDSELRPLGAEVLIRWIHPERGQISPAEFIPIAEEVGLIYSIGWWVLETACAQIKTWQQNEQCSNLILSVNVSAKQLHHADFADQVKAAVQHYGINPGLLKLELTESMLLDDLDDTIRTMWSLRDFGIGFSLDDFGTGYSSLQYLKNLPLSQLKIDQSFVRDIVYDNSDRAIVRTIIAMAHSLNLSVIAEGVETKEQRQLLLNIGCTHYQGYLFSKPVPIEEFEALIKQS